MGVCPKPFNYGDRLKLLFDEGGAKPVSMLIDANATSGITFGRKQDGVGDMPWLGYDRRDDPASQREPTDRNADGNNALIGPYYAPSQLMDLSLVNASATDRIMIERVFIRRSQNEKKPVLILDQRKLMIEPVKTRASVGTFTNIPTDDMGLVYYWPIYTAWIKLAGDPFYEELGSGTFSIHLTGVEADLSKGIADRTVF